MASRVTVGVLMVFVVVLSILGTLFAVQRLSRPPDAGCRARHTRPIGPSPIRAST